VASGIAVHVITQRPIAATDFNHEIACFASDRDGNRWWRLIDFGTCTIIESILFLYPNEFFFSTPAELVKLYLS
ncbi:MAG: hypothetical protein PVF09_06515, partial [Desulfobacterales bacterium]